MTPDADMIRRQLSRLPVRSSSAMPEQPYVPPIRYGLITANATTGATTGAIAVGQYARINEFDSADPGNTILIPTSNISTTGWSGSASAIDDSPWSPTLTDFVATSTPNATARFAFTDLPSAALFDDPVYSVIIAIVARRISGGALNLEKVQIVNTSDTVEWTEPGSMTLGSDWELATFRQEIIGTPGRNNWNDAALKFKVDAGPGGTVQIAAAAIRVKYRLTNDAPAAAATNIFRTALVRMEATTVGKNAFYHNFGWGYEIIRAEP